MKKHIKLVVFFLSLLIVFGTYKIFSKNMSKLKYIALGDSIAEGMFMGLLLSPVIFIPAIIFQ